jgi:hypothetical protein
MLNGRPGVRNARDYVIPRDKVQAFDDVIHLLCKEAMRLRASLHAQQPNKLMLPPGLRRSDCTPGPRALRHAAF